MICSHGSLTVERFHRSFGEHLAALPNLKALRLSIPSCEPEELQHLATVKNLMHLDLTDFSFGNIYQRAIVLSHLLVNSRSTLRSLKVQANAPLENYFCQWKAEDIHEGTTTSVTDEFSALKSLALLGTDITDKGMNVLRGAVDFMRLRELDIGRLRDRACLFFPHLTKLAATAQEAGSGISLRSLRLLMSGNASDTPEQKKLDIWARTRFISSFNTLTRLELESCSQYPEAVDTNPGLPAALLQAIFKHRNLKTLRIWYKGRTSGLKIPYLSAATVRKIVDGLPDLQVFEFAPEEAQLVNPLPYL